MAVPVDKACKSVMWGTPESILEPVRRYFGGRTCLNKIGLDPYTSASNPTKAHSFFTADDDGHTRDWFMPYGSSGVYVNPPYGRQHYARAVAKIALEAQRLPGPVVCLLPGNRTETRYMQAFYRTPGLLAEVRIRKRVPFVDMATGEKAKNGNPYPSLLYVFDDAEAWPDVVECFGGLGFVLNMTTHS